MIIRRVILPLGLVLGLALAFAPAAHAGDVHVGFGVAIGGPIGPVGPRHVGVRHRVAPAGHWVLREREVWHPGALIGYDAHGYPIYTQGHWDVVQERVWVPAPRPVVRRRVVRPHVFVRVGGRIR